MYTVITHNGSFHPDDVFAVATLQLRFGKDNLSIKRSRNEADFIGVDFLVDVGGVYDPDKGRFDHHQNGAPIRENGIPYAAFGLVWKEFGEKITGSKEVSESIEKRLVQAIDAPDNGISLFTVSEHNIEPVLMFHVLHTFKPVWGSGKNIDDSFLEAVDFARLFLARLIEHNSADRHTQSLIKSVYDKAENKSLLVFEQKINSHALVEYGEVKVIVCPSETENSTSWRASAVPEAHGTFSNRVYFPESWAGLEGKELAEVSGIKDAIFCHKARFLFGAASREGAIAGAKLALEN